MFTIKKNPDISLATKQSGRAAYELFAEYPDVLDSKQAAKALNICVKTIRELAIKGEITGVKIGAKWLFPKTSLLAFLKEGDING